MISHRLSEYVSEVGPIASSVPSLSGDPVVTQVTYDSREVIPGALFICKGVHFELSYLRQAVERGTVAYICERACPDVEIPAIVVTDIREAIARAGTLFYDHDWDSLTLVGVTSTKGKSTTTTLIHEILVAWAEATGKPRPGILTSIVDEDGVSTEEATRTTPETLDLYRHLHNAAVSNLGFMCVEVSSQALRYKRVANVRFEVGCFLNISEDHISPHEHPDYEDYLSAKLEIFAQSRMAVVNMRTQDLDRVMEASARCERRVTFALREPGADDVSADVVGHGIRATPNGQEFTAEVFGETYEFAIGMPGSFNVENALAAIAASWCLGVPVEHIREGLLVARVPGRMEVFHLRRGTTVIVDYAHQKLSVQTLLEWAKKDYPSSPISMVFGAPGEKAWNRRGEFGLLAGENADEIYLTEEDPGEVSVEEICQEIDEHVRATGHKPSHIMPDRRAAIARAVREAPDDGLVLILGKGSERWQYRGVAAVTVPSDVDTVRELLAGDMAS